MKNYLFMAIFGLVACAPAVAWCQFPASNNLEFDILRDGDRFGSHTIYFDQERGTTTAHIKIKMKVKLAFMTLFKYKHENTEVYKGNHLVSIDAHTEDNGKQYRVTARRVDNRIEVDGPEGLFDAPGDISASTYWSKEMLFKGVVLNTQTGALDKINAKKLGYEQVEVAGEYVKAEHYLVETPEQDFEIWYDVQTGQMVDLRFEIMGSTIDYNRKTPMQLLTASR